MCPRCEGMGQVNDIDLSQLYDDSKSLSEGALKVPGYTADGWHMRIVRGRGPRPGQADPQVHEEGARHLSVQRADQGEGREHQPHLRGPRPADPEVVPVQGRRRAAAAHPRVRGARGHVHDLSRLQGHAAQRGRAVVEDQQDQHRRRVRDADQRSGRVGARVEGAVGRAAAGEARGTRSTRSSRLGLAISASTGRPARSRAARRSARRWSATSGRRSPT